MTDVAIKIQSAKLGQTHLFFIGQAGFAFKSSKGTLLGVDMYTARYPQSLLSMTVLFAILKNTAYIKPLNVLFHLNKNLHIY